MSSKKNSIIQRHF